MRVISPRAVNLSLSCPNYLVSRLYTSLSSTSPSTDWYSVKRYKYLGFDMTVLVSCSRDVYTLPCMYLLICIYYLFINMLILTNLYDFCYVSNEK